MFGFVVIRIDTSSGEILEREVFGPNLQGAIGYTYNNNESEIRVGYTPSYSVWYEDGAYRYKVDLYSGRPVDN